MLSRGDRVLVLESGLFAVVWGEMARMLGRSRPLPGSARRAVDPAALETRLRADRDGRIKASSWSRSTPASGCVNDLPAIRAAIDAAGHDALLMVDCIASLATMPFDMDGWQVDVAVTGSQKGLMTPPGLSFVAAGPRGRRHRSAGLRTRYWDWTEREGDQHYQKYCGTPPEHLLFGLRRALDLLREEGLDNVLRHHRLLAEAVRRAVAVWAEGGVLDFNILPHLPSAPIRSPPCSWPRATIRSRCRVLRAALRRRSRREIGPLSGRALRIAHGPRQRADDPRHAGRGSNRAGRARRRAPQGGLQAAIDWLGGAIGA